MNGELRKFILCLFEGLWQKRESYLVHLGADTRTGFVKFVEVWCMFGLVKVVSLGIEVKWIEYVSFWSKSHFESSLLAPRNKQLEKKSQTQGVGANYK